MGLELGTKIRQLRKFSGMTQEQLAEKLHVSRQALSKWENDTSLPDLESVIKISTLFRISLEELLLEEKAAEESFAVKRHTACDDQYYDGGVCLRAQDETDRISYRCTKDGQEEMISEEAYAKIYKEYEKSTVVSFGYGAGV